MKLKSRVSYKELLMNNYAVLFLIFFTNIYSQSDFSNQLTARYGKSENDFSYNEIYFDTKFSFNRPSYRIDSVLAFELSDPPEIGLNEKGLREFLLGFYNQNISFEIGDIYQTWGRGLLLNQLDYQNLDFNTGSSGLGFQYESRGKSINLIAGNTSSRKSTTVLGNYNSRVPNYFIDQFIYGGDFNLTIDNSKVGAALLFVNEDKKDLNHSLSNFRIEKSYKNGEFYFSLISKISDKGAGNTEIIYKKKKGSGFYISSTNYFKDWALTSSFRQFEIDVNNPYLRDNIVDNYGQALDIQRSPSGFYQHTFRLLSVNSREVNLNDEIGLELQLLGPLNQVTDFAFNYMKSSSTKRWYNGSSLSSGEWLSDNNSFPSSSKDSYPYEEIFVEISGYSKDGNTYYKVGLDFQDQVLNVQSNSAENKSFEISQSLTLPFLVSMNVSPLFNIELQIELQRLKTGFETTIVSDTDNNGYSFHSLLSEDHQKNIFLSIVANYKSKWSFSLSHEKTNSDESIQQNNPQETIDSSNNWNSTSVAYKFNSDHMLEIFYGSMRGGLDCTNGVCRYIQSFDDGIRIDYSRNID